MTDEFEEAIENMHEVEVENVPAKAYTATERQKEIELEELLQYVIFNRKHVGMTPMEIKNEWKNTLEVVETFSAKQFKKLYEDEKYRCLVLKNRQALNYTKAQANTVLDRKVNGGFF